MTASAFWISKAAELSSQAERALAAGDLGAFSDLIAGACQCLQAARNFQVIEQHLGSGGTSGKKPSDDPPAEWHGIKR